jgi:MPBQ/MSBQ methyltransferase
VVGPLPPGGRLARRLAEAWMLFPTEDQYREWFTQAGFDSLETAYVDAPWQRDGGAPYGLAIAGRKRASGDSPAAHRAPAEDLDEPLTIGRRARLVGRFALGSLAGAAFVPIGIALNLRVRLARRRI